MMPCVDWGRGPFATPIDLRAMGDPGQHVSGPAQTGVETPDTRGGSPINDADVGRGTDHLVVGLPTAGHGYSEQRTRVLVVAALCLAAGVVVLALGVRWGGHGRSALAKHPSQVVAPKPMGGRGPIRSLREVLRAVRVSRAPARTHPAVGRAERKSPDVSAPAIPPSPALLAAGGGLAEFGFER
jgi:hypothetical protein